MALRMELDDTMLREMRHTQKCMLDASCSHSQTESEKGNFL